MNTLLAQRQQTLSEQIESERQALADLQSALNVVGSEMAELAAQREQFRLLGVVCETLEQMREMDCADLFWGEDVSAQEQAQKITRSRNLSEEFDGKFAPLENRRAALLEEIEVREGNLCELAYRYNEVMVELEESRYDYVIERAANDDKVFRAGVLPWSRTEEDRQRLRKALLASLLLMLVIGGVPLIWEVPARDPNERVEIPERLARMVKEKVPPKPVERPAEQPREELREEPKPEQPQVAEQRPEPTPEEVKRARTVAQTRGVLAHSSLLSDLQDDAVLSNLGSNARISGSTATGGAESRGAEGSRALITASGGSGGAAAVSAVSRGGVGTGSGSAISGSGVATGAITSEVASIQESARPLSEGAGPSRTDEEIQIVFDRHKSALYRLYNRELRNNPSLRGKMVLELTIEPDGSVSACRVVSTDLASPSLSADVVERVSRFNFGAKDGVPSITIRYPIDFLPAG